MAGKKLQTKLKKSETEVNYIKQEYQNTMNTKHANEIKSYCKVKIFDLKFYQIKCAKIKYVFFN